MAAKFLGGFLVIFGIYIIGMSFSYKERERLKNIKALRYDINMLISELLHNRNTFYNSILLLDGRLKPIYNEIIKGLDNNNSASLAWSFAFLKYRDMLFLKKDDINDIKNISMVFSSPDYTYQKRELESFIERLEDKIKDLETNFSKNNRICKNVTLSLAIFVVIILF
ncbi:MAG: stage III sporulation protein AB [Lachnospirales bacterium]